MATRRVCFCLFLWPYKCKLLSIGFCHSRTSCISWCTFILYLLGISTATGLSSILELPTQKAAPLGAHARKGQHKHLVGLCQSHFLSNSACGLTYTKPNDVACVVTKFNLANTDIITLLKLIIACNWSYWLIISLFDERPSSWTKTHLCASKGLSEWTESCLLRQGVLWGYIHYIYNSRG